MLSIKYDLSAISKKFGIPIVMGKKRGNYCGLLSDSPDVYWQK
jgi:hypothetical protein